MKKRSIVLVALAGLILTGCGAKGGTTATNKSVKNNVASLDIKSIDYGTLDSIEKGKELIVVDLKLKNDSKDKYYVMDDSFYLVEKEDDEKISGLSPRDMDLESSDMSYIVQDTTLEGDLSPDKSMTGKIYFEIEKDKEYELFFASNGFDEKTAERHDDVAVDLDLSKAKKDSKDNEQPTKALKAYVDVVMLGKENKDYEKLVFNDVDKEKELVEKAFSKNYKDFVFLGSISDQDLEKIYPEYAKRQQDTFGVKYEIADKLSDVASIKLTGTGLSSDNVYSKSNDVRQAFSDKQNNFDLKAENAYVVEHFSEVLEQVEPSNILDTIFVMTKKEDKWNVQLDSDKLYENKKLLNAYVGLDY